MSKWHIKCTFLSKIHKFCLFFTFGMSEGELNEIYNAPTYNNNNKNAKNVNFIIYLNEKQTFKGMIRKLVTNDKQNNFFL